MFWCARWVAWLNTTLDWHTLSWSTRWVAWFWLASNFWNMDFFMFNLGNFCLLSLNFLLLLFYFNFFLLDDLLLFFFHFSLFFFSFSTCFSPLTFLLFKLFSSSNLGFSINNFFVDYLYIFVLSSSSDSINFSWFSISNSCLSFSTSGFLFGYNGFGLLIDIFNNLSSNISFNFKFLYSFFISNFLSDNS